MSDVEVAEQLLGAVETLTLAVVQFLHGPDGGRRLWSGHNRGIPVHFFLKPLENNDLQSRRTISHGTLGNS